MSDLQNMIFDDEHVEMLPARTQLTLLGLLGSNHGDTGESQDSGESHGHYGVGINVGSGNEGAHSVESSDNADSGWGDTGSEDTGDSGSGDSGHDGGLNISALNGSLNNTSALNGFNVAGGGNNN